MGKILTLMLLATLPLAAAVDGEAVYKKACAVCHQTSKALLPGEGVEAEVARTLKTESPSRVPDRDALKQRTPEQILASLTTGIMTSQGALISDAERRAVSEWLAGKPFGTDGPADPNAGKCSGPSKPFDPAAGPSWNGWGVDSSNTRFQSAAAAGLTAEQVKGLKLKWAFGFPSAASAFSQPAVVGGRVFVGSATGIVYSLDAATGCVHWQFQAASGVRTALSVGAIGRRHAVYFGDLVAHAYAVDAATGQLIWKTKVEEHALARITGAPKLHGGRLYVSSSSWEEGAGRNPDYECCTFRGSVTALDAATGKQVWKTYTIAQAPKPMQKRNGHQLHGPAGAAIWSSPTVDTKRKAIYIATGNAYTEPAAETSDAVLAFDMNTGKTLWARQATPRDSFLVGCGKGVNCPENVGPDVDFGSSPILRDLPGGKSVLVLGQKSSVVYAFDPDRQGEIVWQQRTGQGSALGGVMWGSSADQENAYVALADPLSPKPGGLFAFKLATGEKLWQTPVPTGTCKGRRGCTPAQSAAITAIPGAVFSGSMDGHLRAYSTSDGSIIWDFDTAQEFPTVNQVKARGGSMDGPGPVVVGGMVFVNSGYCVLGVIGMPGNVLLAFEPTHEHR